MLTKNIALMTAEIDAHRAADRLVQGDYYDSSTGRGCFVGCLAHDNDTAVIADRFGVPEPLTRLMESIFESLPFDEAADFFAAIPRAIGRDGKDLTKAHWAFLADTLRHLPETDARDVVTDVIAGMDLLAAGQDWPGAAKAMEMAWSAVEARAAKARVAARAAEAAGRAAAAAVEVAWSVVEVAWSAAAAARAGAEETRRQRDAILRLIREA